MLTQKIPATSDNPKFRLLEKELILFQNTLSRLCNVIEWKGNESKDLTLDIIPSVPDEWIHEWQKKMK